MANPGERTAGTTSPAGSMSGHRPEGAAAGGVAGAAQEAVRQVTSATAGTAQQAWDTAGRQAQQLAATAGEAWGDVSRFAGRYPLPVFLAGVGVGFLLARVLESRPTDMTRRMSQASAR